jgi:hypothetical protein
MPRAGARGPAWPLCPRACTIPALSSHAVSRLRPRGPSPGEAPHVRAPGPGRPPPGLAGSPPCGGPVPYGPLRPRFRPGAAAISRPVRLPRLSAPARPAASHRKASSPGTGRGKPPCSLWLFLLPRLKPRERKPKRSPPTPATRRQPDERLRRSCRQAPQPAAPRPVLPRMKVPPAVRGKNLKADENSRLNRNFHPCVAEPGQSRPLSGGEAGSRPSARQAALSRSRSSDRLRAEVHARGRPGARGRARGGIFPSAAEV